MCIRDRGTVAQKYMGLYQATQLFFSDYLIHLSFIPIPLPGFPILMIVLCVNMACKLVFKSPWKASNAGIIISHISIIFLLAGGLVTSLFSKEGFVDLGQGQTKSYLTDYHQRQFLISSNGEAIASLNPNDISQGDRISLSSLPFIIQVIDICQNCSIAEREIDENDTRTYHSMAKFMQLRPDELKQDNETNMGGITFEIFTKKHKTLGIYTMIEDVPKLPIISIDGDVYELRLQKKRSALPFSIDLVEFNRELYPGTQNAKSYQSHVRITDKNGSWDSLISMNQPLRYKGYTFYQSSFLQTDAGDISVLAVVWNLGRSFPYIAGIILSIGLMAHIIVRQILTDRR